MKSARSAADDECDGGCATMNEQQQQQLGTLPALDDYRRRFRSEFVRAVATNKGKHDRTDSHVELVTLPVNVTNPAAPTEQYQEVAICHISTLAPLTYRSSRNGSEFLPWKNSHEDVAIISLAIQHLNTGDGSLVPQVQGLSDRCSVRFTTEVVDTQFNEGESLRKVVEMVSRDDVAEGNPKPCAFLGAYRSTVSITTALATGVFGYPQVSGFSTSTALDDSTQFPFFARTIPGDDGNAIPVIIYMKEVLKIDHLAVIHATDAYGTAFAEGLRRANYKYAPNLKIHQIAIDSGTIDDNLELAARTVIQSLLKVGQYQYVFMVAFGRDLHDAILLEAVEQGMAGTGKHNWMFADSFIGTTRGRVFDPGSPLQRAYNGAGYFHVAGGLRGAGGRYDNFQTALSKVNNPSDMDYIQSILPQHEMMSSNSPQYVNETDFLKPLIGDGSFMYDATIALGLAACQASNTAGLNFTGQQHFDNLINTTFDGISGMVQFNQSTGTREADTTLYQLVNIQPTIQIDLDTGVEVITYDEVVVSRFDEGEWKKLQPFVFNDNTSVIQPDLSRDATPTYDLAWAISIALAISLVVVVVTVVVILDFKRKKIDSVWVVDRAELKFAEPPEVIGRGNFGVVLSAEYKGTRVAVKRALTPVANTCFSKRMDDSSSVFKRRLGNSRMENDDTSFFQSSYGNGHNHDEFVCSTTQNKDDSGAYAPLGTGLGGVSGNPLASQGGFRRRRKRDFIDDMRILAKLRHPCITTVMGAVITGEPMLILELMDNGSLHDLLHNDTIALEGDLVFPVLGDIIQGLRFLHSFNPQYIHGDLKSANILVDSRFRAKVADFGLSPKSPIGGTGTPYWMAPELLRRESGNTIASDAYAFGVLLYEVFSRCDPYKGEDSNEVLLMIADKTVQKRPIAPKHVPDQVVAVMRECFMDDPSARPPFEEIECRLKRTNPVALGFDTSLTNRKQRKDSVSLFDIFPRHIAEALRDGRKVEAEHKDIVTVFFSDIVGFTYIAAGLEPKKVADMLDRLYTKLDTLSEKHVVFKVETIGDAYMAVSNLVKDQAKDHVARIAAFARDAILEANETHIDIDAPEKGFINLRCGFHSGPVVADVVGTKNPRYCLFGDTVNTASRMESHSAKNRIHCSSSSANILRRQDKSFPLKSRGMTQIKGKGQMRTFWVNESDTALRKEKCVLRQETTDSTSGDTISNTQLPHNNLDQPAENPSKPKRDSRTWEYNEAIDDVESLLPVYDRRCDENGNTKRCTSPDQG